MRILSEKETETFFKLLDQSTELIQKSTQTSYLDAFIEDGQNILAHEVHVEDGKPEPDVINDLNQIYQQIDLDSMSAETIRRAIQLVMLKAVNKDAIQANHQLTPDTISFLMGYMIMRLVKDRSELSILDPAVGTGNLLTAIMNQITSEIHLKVDATGIDNDDSLLEVANISAQMQKLPLKLIHQDSLSQLDIKPVDLVVTDLPVGFYPIELNAQKYQTKSAEGYSYAHHLLIEQSMNHVKPGGWGAFLVPSQLFDTKESKRLLQWMQDNAYLQALINLPQELFINKQAQKAIMLLQKPGNGAKQVEKVMLGEFPSFKDQSAFQKFIAELVEWEQQNFE